MANHDNNNEIKEGFVDISSNKQVNKIYKKRGRAIRITSIVLSILLLIGGSGLLYYYSVLNSLKFVDISDNNSTKATSSTLPTSDGTFSKSQLSNDELLEDSKVLNVMLFGEDNAKGEKFGRSDSMIMLSIDNRHKKLKNADAAFLGAFQHGLYFLNAPGRGCFLYGLFCGLPYLGRQALPFVFQDCSLPFHSQR